VEDLLTTGKDDPFFGRIPATQEPGDVFDEARFVPAPDDALLCVTDVRGSTQAVAQGRQKAVNFVAAMAIAGLRNLCRPTPVPALFGGDGTVVLVPAEQADAARRVLARIRRLSAADYALDLRAAALQAGELRARGTPVLVARYEPTPGNQFGIFRGGGVHRLEAAMKGAEPDLAALAAVRDDLDDGEPPDLTGLSCRWDELQSLRGTMLSIIIESDTDLAGTWRAIMAIAARDGDPRAAKLGNLRPRWPSRGLWLEACAAGGWRSAQLLRVGAISLFAWAVLRLGMRLGSFDPQTYKEDIVANTDFGSYDGRVCLVLDVSPSAREAIEAELARRAEAGLLRYGVHASRTAQMTCLVTSLQDRLHTHFIDGGDGGYTSAARILKAMHAT
jgi:hypothetical protein